MDDSIKSPFKFESQTTLGVPGSPGSPGILPKANRANRNSMNSINANFRRGHRYKHSSVSMNMFQNDMPDFKMTPEVADIKQNVVIEEKQNPLLILIVAIEIIIFGITFYWGTLALSITACYNLVTNVMNGWKKEWFAGRKYNVAYFALALFMMSVVHGGHPHGGHSHEHGDDHAHEIDYTKMKMTSLIAIIVLVSAIVAYWINSNNNGKKNTPGSISRLSSVTLSPPEKVTLVQKIKKLPISLVLSISVSITSIIGEYLEILKIVPLLISVVIFFYEVLGQSKQLLLTGPLRDSDHLNICNAITSQSVWDSELYTLEKLHMMMPTMKSCVVVALIRVPEHTSNDDVSKLVFYTGRLLTSTARSVLNRGEFQSSSLERRGVIDSLNGPSSGDVSITIDIQQKQ